MPPTESLQTTKTSGGAFLASRNGVLRLLVHGSSNSEIAQVMVITLNTTKKHVAHILEKQGVRKRAEAASPASELELITPSVIEN